MAFIDQNQKLMKLLSIFREKVSNVDTSRFGKCEKKAAELRKQGNDLFVQDHFNQAIDLYTEVCMYVIHEVRMSKCHKK